jgi:hypothetical protein
VDNESSFASAIESSERLPLIVAGRMPSSGSSVLFILCAYRHQDLTRDAGLLTQATLRILDGMTLGRLRSHRTIHRDHYANPRSFPYLIGLAQRFRQEADLRQAPDLVVDRGFNVEAQSPAWEFGRVEITDLRRPQQSDLIRDAANGCYDAVVLVWADALGLGWESLQRFAKRLPVAIAINGRRRAFPLDLGTRRALGLRRYFAYTRLAETMFALCVYPVAGFCALIDAVRRP